MLSHRLLSIAVTVATKSDAQHPADSVLRVELKNARGISRADGAEISAAVFAYYRWFGWVEKQTPIPEQIKRGIQLDEVFQKNPASVTDAELKCAVPGWAESQIDISSEWLRTLQTKPNLWLRARLGEGRGLAEKLGESWVGEETLADAVRYEGKEDLFRTAEFHAGEFELQDISSQIVGLICHPQPGETWWDACAGEGGKTLHLCDLMQGKGLVWASDRAEWRLKKLKLRAARAKAFNYRAALWDGGAKLPTKTKFDGILVDAPCSGIGTWQRNPQARWTTTAQDIVELAEVQKNLLANVAGSLKPGGRLIYSVCTLSDAETKGVADAISEQFPELRALSFSNPASPKEPAVNRLMLWPQNVDGNGMFICGWEKTA